jgi:hypothetical protein
MFKNGLMIVDTENHKDLESNLLGKCSVIVLKINLLAF